MRDTVVAARAVLLAGCLACAMLASPGTARADSSDDERLALLAPLAGRLSRVAFPSQAIGKTRAIYVYTPPGYRPTTAPLPVLVLLHGSPGNAMDWIVRGRVHVLIDKAIQSGQLLPCLVVYANGIGPYYKGGSEWADSADGSWRMESSIVQDLPRFICARYRAASSASRWTLAGLSEGGYGAANLVVRNPHRFRGAVVLSGDFAVSDDWPDAHDVFGDDPVVRRQNSPIQHIERLSPETRSALRFYVATGDADARVLTNASDFVALCKRLGVWVRFDRGKGKHDWRFWSSRLAAALPVISGWWREPEQ